MAARGERGLGGPIGVSAALHASVAVLVLLVGRSERAAAPPPVYSVNIVAAPPGPRQIGEVRPTPPPDAPPETPPPQRAAAPTPDVKNLPPAGTRTPPPTQRTPPRSTPSPTAPTKTVQPATPAPRAGGGPTGGPGADVATVRTEGTAFPYPGYLNNIVRQIALRFKPDGNNTALTAEVMFLIRRDGTVTSVQITRRSGVYAFDLEARAAIEAAARANAFGALPEGFAEDVLPVYFSFDPRVLR